MTFKVNINGIDHTVDVDGDTPLWVLRDVLGMTGTKFGCGMALCGACTVHQDGNAIRSCSTTIDSVGESAITISKQSTRRRPVRRFRRHGSILRLSNAATASPVRLCPRLPCWRARPIRLTAISMTRCRATFAVAMPRPPTAHRHPHSNARQFDLLCDAPYAAAQTPQWQALPAETRHTLTKLMVRLIFGHADGDLAREREEMRHDV
jgi:hypothetical protein